MKSLGESAAKIDIASSWTFLRDDQSCPGDHHLLFNAESHESRAITESSSAPLRSSVAAAPLTLSPHHVDCTPTRPADIAANNFIDIVFYTYELCLPVMPQRTFNKTA